METTTKSNTSQYPSVKTEKSTFVKILIIVALFPFSALLHLYKAYPTKEQNKNV